MKSKPIFLDWQFTVFSVLIVAFIGLMANNFALADDQDTIALLLADKTPTTIEPPSEWRSFVEGSYAGSTQRDSNAIQQSRRLSFDLRYDGILSSGWRAVLADRLDINLPPQNIDPLQTANQKGINTIKESYLSWQVQADTLMDIGRINVHEGVAMGYNPTDYFRSGAVRSIVSVDPVSLKDNRQGSVMLRGQTLWESGSTTALYSPKLSAQANSGSFNPDWGATNNLNRWLISVSQKISNSIKPEFLVYKETALPAQFGFNLTGLINDATVAYFEWSGGRSPSLLVQALAGQVLPYTSDIAFRNRISSGMTYTTANNISLTAELEYNGGGMNPSDWNALYRNSPTVYGLYRYMLLGVRDSPTKQVGAFYGKWQDALINHLDFSAMELYDASDYSRLSWLETRYHIEHTEFALQWQRYSGHPLSDFGAAPQMQSWQVVMRRYF